MVKKRFIAGAICPQCQAQDRLVVETTHSGDTRRCVTCGFTDVQPSAGEPTLPTRYVRRGLLNAETSAIKILDD